MSLLAVLEGYAQDAQLLWARTNKGEVIYFSPTILDEYEWVKDYLGAVAKARLAVELDNVQDRYGVPTGVESGRLPGIDIVRVPDALEINKMTPYKREKYQFAQTYVRKAYHLDGTNYVGGREGGVAILIRDKGAFRRTWCERHSTSARYCLLQRLLEYYEVNSGQLYQRLDTAELVRHLAKMTQEDCSLMLEILENFISPWWTFTVVAREQGFSVEFGCVDSTGKVALGVFAEDQGAFFSTTGDHPGGTYFLSTHRMPGVVGTSLIETLHDPAELGF